MLPVDLSMLKVITNNYKVPEYNYNSKSISDNERDFIIRALKETDGNVEKTARNLSMCSRTLYRKLKKYDIDPKDYLKL